MRVRAMTDDYDMAFGHNGADFFIDSPKAVAQLVLTRLRLWLGEWFLNLDSGTPWLTQVLGTGTTGTYDAVIRARIFGTTGVLGIESYSSSVNKTERSLAVNVTVNTIFSSNLLTILNDQLDGPNGNLLLEVRA